MALIDISGKLSGFLGGPFLMMIARFYKVDNCAWLSVLIKSMCVLVSVMVSLLVQTSWALDGQPAAPGPDGGSPKPAAPFPLGNKVSRNLQKYTGINWVTGVVAGKVAGALIRHKIGGKAKVKVKTYSFTDLIAGKLKSVDVKLEGSQVEGVKLGRIEVKADSPIWYYPYKNKSTKRGLHNPVNFAVKGDLNQEDVEKALASQEITSAIRGFKLDLPGLGDRELEVLEPKVDIEKGLVRIDGTLVTKGAKADTGVPLKIEATPKLVANNEIFLTNLKVDSPYIVEPEKFAYFMSDLLNPIVRLSRYDRTTHAFRLLSLDVSDSSVKGEGNLLLVPKDYQSQAPKKNSAM